MPSTTAPRMSAWTLAMQREPMVRIGIVLAQDGQRDLVIEIPTVDYTLDAGDGGEAAPAGALLALHLDGETVAFTLGDQRLRRASCIRLMPRTPTALVPGAGVMVRDIVAGRGFHWQKRIHQFLSGVLEIVPAAGGLVVVNELPLEDYLAGVITAEMSGACPPALLAAQCIVARSWLLALTEPKHGDEPFDRCNDDCCQRYQGTGDLSPTALEATHATRGQVLRAPTGVVLDANYAKSCGGISETPVAVWGFEKPGLSAIVDAPPGAAEHRFFPLIDAHLDEYLDGPWVARTTCFCSPNVVPLDAIGRYLGRVDTTDDYFRWTVRYPQAELAALLRERMTDAAELTEVCDLRVRGRGVSGRAYSVEVLWRDTAGREQRSRLDSEYRIRQVLHRGFLYSSAFAVRPERTAEGRLTALTLRGAGWGHGVGLCQIGALGMALLGYDHRQICTHYYPQAELVTAYG